MLKLLDFFNPLAFIKACTFYMDTGGNDKPTTQNVNQVNLPSYAKPFFKDLMRRSQALSYQQYTPYSGERIAGFTPEQRGVQQEYMGLGTPGQFGEAAAGMRGVGGLGMGAAAMGLGRALSYDPSRTYGTPEAQQYMSPYQQAVTDTALREARQQGNLQKQSGAMGAINRGTFGGARQALMQAEGERNLMRTLGDIQAKGSQDAFMQGQQQFNAEEARRLQAAGLGAQMFGQGIGAAQQAAAGLGGLGTAEQQANLQRLQAQQGVAAQQQQMNQNQMDIAYQDFLRQRDYPQEMLGFYSNMMRGLPVQLSSTQQTYQAAPSIGQQMMGYGLGALSLGKMFG